MKKKPMPPMKGDKMPMPSKPMPGKKMPMKKGK